MARYQSGPIIFPKCYTVFYVIVVSVQATSSGSLLHLCEDTRVPTFLQFDSLHLELRCSPMARAFRVISA